MHAGIGVARVALAHVAVGDIAVDMVGGQGLQAALTVVARVGQIGGAINRTRLADSGKVITHTIDHRLEQIVFLRRAVRLRVDNHLMRTVNGSDADIALHHAVTTLQCGALGVGQVALDRGAFGAQTFAGGGQRRAQFVRIFAQGGDGALFVPTLVVFIRIERFAGILLRMCFEEMGYGAFHLGSLALKVRTSAAPLFRSVRRQLAAVDGEHAFADETLGVAHHQDVAEYGFYLSAQRRHKVRQGGEVRLLITGQSNELHVLGARPRHRAR